MKSLIMQFGLLVMLESCGTKFSTTIESNPKNDESDSSNTEGSTANILIFTSWPTNSQVNDANPSQIIVEVRNGSGVLQISNSSVITLSFADNGNPFPATATLAGTTSVAAVNGVATFSDITIDVENFDYILKAMGTDMISAQSPPFNVFINTPVFRSVGPGNTTSLANGSGNRLTITSTTATFETALASNIGVGDVIQFDSDDDNLVDSLAFIHGRLSDKVFKIRNVSGGVLAATAIDDMDWEIFRAYTSASNAESGIENTGIDNTLENFDTWTNNNITSISGSNTVWNIALYGNGTADTTLYLIGRTTAANNYLRLYTPVYANEVGVTQRHSGVWDPSKYVVERTSTNTYRMVIRIETLFVKIEGLQIEMKDMGWDNCSGVDHLVDNDLVGELEVSYNIIKSSGGGLGGGFYGDSNHQPGGIIKIHHNIIYNQPAYGMITYGPTASFYIYNNTIYNAGTGIRSYQGTVIAINNLIQNITIDGYTGIFSAGTTNNISEYADAPGANPIDSTTVDFVDTGAENFHLDITDVSAVGAGVDLSNDAILPINRDIDHTLRFSSWDIGADQR